MHTDTFTGQREPALRPTDRSASADRRRATRRAVGEWIPNAWVVADGAARLPVVVRDITCEGVGFETKVPLSPGTIVTLGLDCPVWAEPVRCLIVHQIANGGRKEHIRYRHGGRFLDTDARKAKVMADLL